MIQDTNSDKASPKLRFHYWKMSILKPEQAVREQNYLGK